MAPGFWLSFGAVAILLRIVAAPMDPSAGLGRRVAARLGQASHLQLLVTLGLTPLLAFWVGQVSVGSPLANAVAIPAVSFLVTPLSLLCALFAAIPGAERLAAGAGAGGAGGIRPDHDARRLGGRGRLGQLRRGGRAPGPGCCWRWRAWPGLAGARLAGAPLGVALDAAVAVLASRAARAGILAADGAGRGAGRRGAAGNRHARAAVRCRAASPWGSDVGEWVVAPYLRARGIRMLDDLVLSHVHMDHVGGTRAVLNARWRWGAAMRP